MYREDRRCKPSTWEREAQQQTPEQQHVQGVERQIDGVVPEGFEAPQLVVEPEGRIRDRPVVPLAMASLLHVCIARLEPKPPDPVPLLDQPAAR